VQGIIDKVNEANKQYLDSVDDGSQSNATREILQLQSEATKKTRANLEQVLII